MLNKDFNILINLPVMTSNNWTNIFNYQFSDVKKIVANVSNTSNVPQCCQYKTGTTICSILNPVYSSLLNESKIFKNMNI